MKSFVLRAAPSQFNLPPSLAIKAAIRAAGKLQKPKRATVPALPLTAGLVTCCFTGKSRMAASSHLAAAVA
jgi:hypothetical protein